MKTKPNEGAECLLYCEMVDDAGMCDSYKRKTK